MNDHSFEINFEALTGHAPFPWQTRLYERFLADREDNIPRGANLPTGLGKTSVIAVWLLALIEKPDRMPRRLVYVVNRRTVVDQTTTEITTLRNRLMEPDKYTVDRKFIPALNRLADGLKNLYDHTSGSLLGISTLRGQYADNAEWSADPSRPAVVCGTVDMIGSRLLFEGYRIGFKSRPLHAGFLGQDALLVHDEAHLEPAFQRLIETIQNEQEEERERGDDLPWPALRVMALSATARGSANDNDGAFGLETPDLEHSVIRQRVAASKTLQLHPCADEKKKLASHVAKLALQYKESGDAILVFLRSVEDALTALKALEKDVPGRVASLTGTMRGHERDQLVRSNPVFARFMPPGDRAADVVPAKGTVFLVCTSAGEVGANLSADHMVCDLSTFDSMAQRLGRVNRFGDRDDTRIDVVHPTPEAFDEKHRTTPARKATLSLLRYLQEHFAGDLSPKALSDLKQCADLPCNIEDAFTPEPTILPATDILFDAWALTSIKDEMPGRPPVAPYLHGVSEWEPPRTSVAWRTEVELVTFDLIARESEDLPQELLADYPLKPHELLSDRTDRVLKALQRLATAHGDSPVWLVDDQQQVHVSTLQKIANPDATRAQDKKPLEEAIAESVVLLPPSIGGLSAGMLDPSAKHADDVADYWTDENNQPRRQREFSDDAEPANGPEGMALIRTIDTDPLADEISPTEQEDEAGGNTEPEREPANEAKLKRGRFWHWYVRPRDTEDATRASARPITLDHHTRDVVNRATTIVEALNLPADLKQAIILAAELHDLGKRREIWQRSIGNPNPTDWHAKPGKPDCGPRWRPRHLGGYRHEFGSLLDALDPRGNHVGHLTNLSDQMRDTVLHLIAAHHGHARPHFPNEAIVDPNYPQAVANEHAVDVMRRYARLQRRYGRWGLAYLESLLRAADWAASAQPSRCVEPPEEVGI